MESGYDKSFKGLENRLGANNCFLNVVIQSLWHLASFRENFRTEELHKHKKNKKTKKINNDYDDLPVMPSSKGYSNIDSNPYPQIEPMSGLGYPSIDSKESFTVPTSTKKAKSSSKPTSTGYPSLDGPSHSSEKSTAYPSFSNAAGLPPPMPAAYDPSPGKKYESPSAVSYPSLDGISHSKYHEPIVVSSAAPRKTTTTYVAPSSHSLAYPSFDDSGNIVSDEQEPTASLQLPYGGVKMAKPDRELSIQDNCLFCNLINLFVNYEYDSSSVLTPSHVRNALDDMTGNNQIQGFAEGSMACAQETFEEILRYLHREYIKPNYYEKYCDKPEKLKKKEEEFEDTGCSLKCVSHNVFGLEIGE